MNRIAGLFEGGGSQQLVPKSSQFDAPVAMSPRARRVGVK